MTRKTDLTLTLDAALKSTSKRLEEALRERVDAQGRLTALNAEIPALQRTIGALQSQLEPKAFNVVSGDTGDLSQQSARNGVPSEVANYLTQEFPNASTVPTVESEDLPEIDGEPVVEEQL